LRNRAIGEISGGAAEPRGAEVRAAGTKAGPASDARHARVFVEFPMLGGVNSAADSARQLLRKHGSKGRPAAKNLPKASIYAPLCLHRCVPALTASGANSKHSLMIRY